MSVLRPTHGELAAVVLATGAGVRLRPLTLLQPKALCPVGNVPLVDAAIERARSVTDAIAVNVHHGREQMLEHLGDRVHVSLEDDEALGTAGALGRLRDWIAGRDVLVINADGWHPAPLGSLLDGWAHEHPRLFVVRDAQRGDFGDLRYTGTCVMPWSDVRRLEAVPTSLYEVSFRDHHARGTLEFVESPGPYFDCGTPAEYHAANMTASGGQNVVGAGRSSRARSCARSSGRTPSFGRVSAWWTRFGQVLLPPCTRGRGTPVGAEVPGDPSSRPIGLERASSDRFLDVVRETGEVMRRCAIPYVLMGGIAVTLHGRPRYTHDVDLLVRASDAQATLDAFATAGYDVSHHDPHWIYKAERDGVTVDVIFRSDGEIYLDDEMLARAVDTDFQGVPVHVMAAEDLIVVKALAADEGIPYHWWDALSIVARGAVDWDYLVQRAQRGVRRVLSLLLFATATDIPVPRAVLDQLYAVASGDEPPPAMAAPANGATSDETTGEYLAGRLREALTHDERVSQQDLDVAVTDVRVTVSGRMPTEQRRDAVLAVAREHVGDRELVDRLEVVPLTPPQAEELA